MKTPSEFYHTARLLEVISVLRMDERWEFDLEVMHVIRNFGIAFCELR